MAKLIYKSHPVTEKSPVPKRLSHFTNLAGLLGIVERQKLWASNVSFLNDRRELKHGLEASLAVIKTLATTTTYQRWQKPLAEVARHLEAGGVPNTYALCLCKSSDVLSQWRGYGGNVQGVSITFDEKKLTEILSEDAAKLYKVTYANLSTRRKVGDRLKAELRDLEDGDLLDELDPKESVQQARNIINRLIPQFKHLGFREEDEYRYVVQQRTIREEVCFRAGASVLIPYITLPKNDGNRLPIVQITVGPGKEQELTKQSIELFLQKNDYAEVSVDLSDVPYRA